MEENPQESRYEEFLAERGFLTIHQLVHYLKEKYPSRSVSHPTIMRYVNKGYLTCTKVGGQFRIDREGIEAFIEHGTENVGEGLKNPSPPTPPIRKPLHTFNFERAEGDNVLNPLKTAPQIVPPDVTKKKSQKGTTNGTT